jgi:hypothetical protein
MHSYTTAPPRRGRRRKTHPTTWERYRRKVVLNFGMGWDSVAILLRWLLDPSSRDFHLDQLIMLMAQVGEEFAQTKRLVEAFIFPLLRFYRIRTVQVARAGPSDKDGIVVLSDTRHPTTLHIEGRWRLGDHLMRDATAPQWANGSGHKCAQRFKGWPLSQWLRKEFGDRPYRSVIGYNADEHRRAEKAADYADYQRTHEYPLIAWGWDRAAVEAFVLDVIGEPWIRSACGFCPFSDGRADLVERHRREPAQAIRALLMEHLSLSINPRFGLFPSGKPLRVILEEAGVTEALIQFRQLLADTPWSVYRVRRIYRGEAPLVDRSIERQATGSREEMLTMLRTLGDAEEAGGTERVYVRRRPERVRPSVEEFYVAAPAIVVEKEKKCFPLLWANHTSGVNQLILVSAPVAEAKEKKKRRSSSRLRAAEACGVSQSIMSL